MASTEREKYIRNEPPAYLHRRSVQGEVETFLLCQKCAYMTSDSRNAKLLNSRQGFNHSSRQELALSSRYCTFCFWLWSQLHRTWKPGSHTHLYIFAKGEDAVIEVVRPMNKGDLMPSIESVSMRQEGWLRRTDQIEGKILSPAGTPSESRQPSCAKFEIVGKAPYSSC